MPPHYTSYGSAEIDPLVDKESYQFAPKFVKRKRKVSDKVIFAVLIFIILIFAILFGVICYAYVKVRRSLPEPIPEWKGPPASESVLGKYDYNSVAADQSVCSQIGSNILNIQNGNAMDAAIATMACMGVVSSYSAGIGGGSFLVFYNKTEGKAYALDYRETAPANSSEYMYVHNPSPTASTFGGLANAIPGEVLGLYTAWERFSSLEWKTLLQPTIDILENGFRVPESLAGAMQKWEPIIDKMGMTELKKYITNPATGKVYLEGELLINEKLADTFKTIAADANSFYTGELAKDIVNEIQTGGGIITLEDLKNYKPKWRTTLSVTLRNGIDLHSLPPPSSGAVLSYIMNIMDGYDYKPGDKSNLKTTSLYYHRLAETFKFAYARRSALGDEDFVNVTKEVEHLTSRDFADETRAKITDDRTHDVKYYHPEFERNEDHGTAHLSVIDSAGNAVAVTATINTYFGSLLRGAKTGIIYNNEMDDFSTPNKTNSFGLPPSPSNFIKPGKRPMSSMSPVIMTNSDGDVVMVSGAAGGSRIISAVAQTSMDVLYFNRTVKEANDFPRFHHQLLPNYIQYGEFFPQDILTELKKKGHEVKAETQKTVVQSIQRRGSGWLANCDFRKGAKPSGL